MYKKSTAKQPKFLFFMALYLAMALSVTACGGNAEKEDPSAAQTEDMTAQDGDVLGEGAVVFPLSIIDKDGNEIRLEIHTDQETVGAALSQLGLIAGDESEYGLYVKTVNGITADYDTDGVYWAFYINDEYASTGVDSTPITEGESYSLRVE